MHKERAYVGLHILNQVVALKQKKITCHQGRYYLLIQLGIRHYIFLL